MREHPEVAASRRPEPDRVELDLNMHGDIEYFVGHFPGAPIVPGVVQIKWAIDFGRGHLGASGDVLTMEVIKFRKVIRPETLVTLSLRFDESRGRLYFSYDSAEGPHSSGRLLLERVS